MLTTDRAGIGTLCDMPRISHIHQGKTPVRRHFIKEWMESRNMKPPELISLLDADRSTVYRWLDGQLPQPQWQERLAALFDIEPDALLRHPDDDWLARFFRNRDASERERIKKAMEIAWPRPTGTDGD